MEAIRTATYNAASVLGIENETGSLKEGLAGDLLIVKGDVSKNIRALDDVQEVYLAGEISVYGVKDMKKLSFSEMQDFLFPEMGKTKKKIKTS